MADKVLSIRELAELLQLSERTVYRLAQSAELPGFKVGGSWRFPKSGIEKWMACRVEETKRKASGDD